MKQASEAIKVCLPADLRREVETVAANEGRSLSNVVRRVVAQWSTQRAADRAKAAA